MSAILPHLVGGGTGILLGKVLLFDIPDWRHRRACARHFDATCEMYDLARHVSVPVSEEDEAAASLPSKGEGKTT